MRSKNWSEPAKTWFRPRPVQRPKKTEKNCSLGLFRSWSGLFGFRKCLDPSRSQSSFFGPKNRTGPDFQALLTVPFIAVCSPWILKFVFASVVPVTLRIFLSQPIEAISRGEGISLHARWLCSHTFHQRLDVPWSRARVRSEASSLKIPQDQLICFEPMHDKKTLKVTDTTKANTRLKIYGLLGKTL